MSDEAILADVIASLENMELIRKSEICYGRVLRTKYGYVVQDDNYRRNLNLAKAYFAQIGLPLCGRVAEFEYINMDVCIERARKVAHSTRRRSQRAGIAVERTPGGTTRMISVAMITMNEEKAVAQVIYDIRAVLAGREHEIVIVDSSKDRTPEIAAELGARVIRQFPPKATAEPWRGCSKNRAAMSW